MVIDYQLSYKAKTFILIYVIFLVSCEVKKPSIEVKTSKKHQVYLTSSNNNYFWGICFPFEIIIDNDSYKSKKLTYYKYFCNQKLECSRGLLYSERDNKLIKEGLNVKEIPSKSSKKYIIYSKYAIDTIKYPRSLFKEYYNKLKQSGLKDSLPIGTLEEFKLRYPKMVENLLRYDSISFNFPRLDKKNKFDIIKVPVPF
ncbi:hypothetical protein [Tenacibaculum sp. 190130A14a]|uniref:Lipoprotein n=1 Tax=Tenacibaculum polynesiense TaxID=3137857 RepID=A0ABP1F858_9FLAO